MQLRRRKWPLWWDWDLELSPHLLKRMVDRGFSEVDLRTMLQRSRGFRRDVVPGRWVIETRYGRASWEVIVEPDITANLLVVVTAYRI